jgi:hypothetical protein
MLRKSMEHVIQEANPGIDSDGLRLRSLRRMAVGPVQEPAIRVGWECATVQIDRQLDLGFVGVARESR